MMIWKVIFLNNFDPAWTIKCWFNHEPLKDLLESMSLFFEAFLGAYLNLKSEVSKNR